jgi:nucleotide-binding universal stress UspA family protein
MAHDTAGIQKLHHIVVGFDMSELSERAVYEALDMAARRAPADLHVVVVALQSGVLPQRGTMVLLPEDGVPLSEDEARDKVHTRITKVYEDYRAKRGTNGVEEISIYVLPGLSSGQTGHLIAEVAKDIDADLIVVGSHGRRGLNRLLLGSVAEKVVREATTSVLVVRPDDFVGATKVPAIEPPLAEGQPHLRHIAHRRIYRMRDRTGESTTVRTMPAV